MREMRRGLQVVFQDPFGSLDPRMTAGDSVREALDALPVGAARPLVVLRAVLHFDRHSRLVAHLSSFRGGTPGWRAFIFVM